MRRRLSLSGRRGFGLLDALGAVGILSLICVSSAWLVIQHHRAELQGAHRIQAAWLARGCFLYLADRGNGALQQALAEPARLNWPEYLQAERLLPGGRQTLQLQPLPGEQLYLTVLEITWGGPGQGRARFTALLRGAPP
jgi:type II secretory pathway component PulK